MSDTPKPTKEVATKTRMPQAPSLPQTQPPGVEVRSTPPPNPRMQQPVSMTAAQIQQAAAAGVKLLGRESTLIPGNIRQQVAVLEVVLQGVVAGRLVVVTPTQNTVESAVKAGISKG